MLWRLIKRILFRGILLWWRPDPVEYEAGSKIRVVYRGSIFYVVSVFILGYTS